MKFKLFFSDVNFGQVTRVFSWQALSLIFNFFCLNSLTHSELLYLCAYFKKGSTGRYIACVVGE